MPSKRSFEPSPKRRPELTVPLERAKADIERQVERGQEIRAGDKSTEALFYEAEQAEQRWSGVNKTMLRANFTTDDFANDYEHAFYGGPVGLTMLAEGRSLPRQVTVLHGILDRRINVLRSIVDQLPYTVRSGGSAAVERQTGREVPLISIQDSPQAHVTIHGTDASASRLDQQTVFAELRKVVQDKVSAADQGALLEKVAELEAAKGKPSYVGRYREFVELAAAHMTVLAPFLPPLTQWLGR